MKFIIYILTKQWQLDSKCSEQLRISILCSKQLRASSECSECFESNVKIWADCQLADEDSHLQLYIDWLKIQSSSLTEVFKQIFNTLNREHYSLKIVQKWVD